MRKTILRAFQEDTQHRYANAEVTDTIKGSAN